MAKTKQIKRKASARKDDDSGDPILEDPDAEEDETLAALAKKSKDSHWTGYDYDSDDSDADDVREAQGIGECLHRLLGTTKPVIALLLTSGWDSAATIALLEDDDIDETCKNLRKPGGGSIGHDISALLPRKLKQLAHCFRYFHIIGDEAEYNTWNTEYLEQYIAHKRMIDKHDFDWSKLNFSNFPQGEGEEDGVKILECFQDIFYLCRSPRGMTLDYVIRDALIPEIEWDRYIEGDEHLSFGTLDEEFAARANIVSDPEADPCANNARLEHWEKEGPYHIWFKEDSRTVANIIAHVVSKYTVLKSVITKPLRLGQGRIAWRMMRSHLMGDGFLDRQTGALEQKLGSLTFRFVGADSKNSVPNHIAKLKSIFVKFEEIEKNSTYRGFDEASKCRALKNSLKGSQFDTWRLMVNNNSEVKEFEKLCAHLLTFCKDNPAFKLSVQQVSEMKAGEKEATPSRDGNGGRGGGRSRPQDDRGGRGGGRGGGGRNSDRGGGEPSYDEAIVTTCMARLR